MKKLISSLSAVLVCFSLSAVDISGTIPSNALTRSFVLHANGATISNNLPVVIALHGDGGSGASFKNGTDFDATADANGFLAVYPSATNLLGTGIWNKQIDNDYAGEPDDVLFISDLIDYLCETYHINASKVYVTGHSGGAFMAYHLAVQLNNKIAAFAPVAGSMYDAGKGVFLNDYLSGGNFVKVPICHIHGDSDPVVGYPDGDFTPIDYQEWPLTGFTPVTCGSLTYSNAAVTTIVAGAQKIPFCDNSATSKEIFLVRLIGKGHEWPNVAGFDVEQYIWNFFSAHQLNAVPSCALSGITENSLTELKISPNPTIGQLSFETLSTEIEYEIVSSNGSVLRKETISTNMVDISISELDRGVYFLRVKNQNGQYRISKIVKI